MKPWNSRSDIEAALFNPAFCGELIRHTVASYNNTVKSAGFPYALSYLVLPFLLNTEIGSLEPRTTRTDFVPWLYANRHIVPIIAEKAKEMKDYTSESLLMYISLNLLSINNNGEIEIGPQQFTRKRNFNRDDVDYLKKRADMLGVWLGKAGDVTTIFSLFSCACFCIVAIMPFIFPLLVNTEYADAYSQIIILMYAMLLRILVGLYSTVYIAEKNSKKVATTSFISAIINLATNIVLISRIGLYAASLSTLLAFGSMAIVRYIDINKSVKMRIKRGIIYSSVIISVVLLVSYYLNNAYINSIVLIAIIVYSYLVNKDFIKSVIKMIKNKLGKKGTY